VPDPQDPETFTRSKLNWDEPYPASGAEDSRHTRILKVYRELARLRRAHPELTDPRFDRLSAQSSEDPRWFRLRRGDLEIVVNLSDEELAISTPDAVLFETAAVKETPAGLVLAPHSGAIIRPAGPSTGLPEPLGI